MMSFCSCSQFLNSDLIVALYIDSRPSLSPAIAEYIDYFRHLIGSA